MGTLAGAMPQPIAGAENAVPWPMPLPSGAQALTFWGSGNTTTGEFTLASDASLRIVVEAGPLTLRVLRPDGSAVGDLATMPVRGLALGAIAEGGTYKLEVRTVAKWGVTVVHGAL
jgi:hypothetical protein